jgi:hypothetical protein
MTTATVALSHGEWGSAAAANPLAYLAAILVVCTLPVLLARSVGLAGGPRPWPAAKRRRVRWAMAVMVALSWLFPLWDAKRQTFADKIISTVVIPE